MKMRLRWRLSPGVFFLPLLAASLLGLAPARAQAPFLSRTANQPETFDTVYPANYALDFPNLPEADPMNDVQVEIPPGIDVLTNPEILDYQAALKSDMPSRSPADYDPEEGNRITDFQNTPQSMALFGNDQASNAEVVLSNAGHPIFYDLSRTVASFGLNETPLVTEMPLIPEPGTTLDKPIAPRAKWGPWRMALDVMGSSSVFYNVFGSTKNPQSDMVFALTPRFYLEAGTKGFFRLSYTPSFLRYSKFKDLDSDNQNLSVSVTYPFSKLRVGASFSYLTQSGLFLNNPSGQGQQDTALASLAASYPLTTRSNISVGWMGVVQQNDPGGRKVENTANLGISYTPGAKAVFGGLLRLGSIQAPAGDQSFFGLQAEAAYRWDFHWRFSARAGVDCRFLDPPPYGQSSPMLTPVFDLNASYHWTSNAAALLRFYRFVGTDTFTSVSMDIQTGAEMGFLLRAYRRTDVKILLTVGYTEMFAEEESGEQNYAFVQGGMSVSYTVMKWADVVLFGNVQQRFQDDQGLNYLSGTLGLGINLKF